MDVVAPSSHFTNEAGECPGDVLTLNLVNGRGNCNDGPAGDPSYRSTFGGTSATAPQVSAVAALVLSREPWLTAAQVRTRITSTADYWGSPSVFGAGKLNASRALGYLPPPPPFAASISGPNQVQSVSSCLFTASTVGGAEPLTYAWTANGYSVGENSSTYRHYNNGWDAFQFGITVTDAQGRVAMNFLSVGVSSSAPECLDQ